MKKSIRDSDKFLIRPHELADLLEIHEVTLWRWHNKDKIPIERVEFNSRIKGYRKADVEEWLGVKL